MTQAASQTINIGDRLPTLTRTITEEMVIAYEELFERIAARSDWKASFHADREAAAQTMYQEPIAQGVLTEAFFSVLISRWLPDPKGWIEGGTLTTKFIAPVWYGDTLTYHAEVSRCRRHIRPPQHLGRRPEQQKGNRRPSLRPPLSAYFPLPRHSGPRAGIHPLFLPPPLDKETSKMQVRF